MATRSTISIILDKKTKRGQTIYCHWDGYPSNNGKLLLEHYNKEAIVKELIALGSLSCLKKNIAPPKGKHHSFEKPLEDVVVAHGRDRGEKDTEAKSFIGTPNRNQEQEYNYLFKDGKWYVRREGARNFVQLTPAMVKKDEDNF